MSDKGKIRRLLRCPQCGSLDIIEITLHEGLIIKGLILNCFQHFPSPRHLREKVICHG